MTTKNININTIPYLHKTIRARDIVDLDGENIQDCSFIDFILLLENKLTYICDILLKLGISEYQGPYVMVGEKALTNIVSKEHVKESLEFDILVYNEQDVIEFSIDIINNILINNINQHYKMHFRKQIYNILLRSNLVEQPEPGDIDNINSTLYYYMNDALIYYGKKIERGEKLPGDTGVATDGLFIKLVFRNNLFTKDKKPFICSNLRWQHALDDYTIELEQLYELDEEQLDEPYRTTIYLPIVNISIEDKLNFGLLSNRMIKKNNFDKINYAEYGLLVYNLIQFIINSSFTDNYKFKKNIKKLKLLLNMALYNCQFIKNNTVDNIKTQITILINMLYELIVPVGKDPKKYYIVVPLEQQLNNLKLYINNTLIFARDTNIIEIIQHFLKAYEKIYLQKEDICTTNKLLDFLNETLETHIIDDAHIHEKLEIEKTFSEIIKALDTAKYIYKYTNHLYQLLNEYCNYISFGLDYTKIPVGYYIANQIIPETIEDVCQTIDTIFNLTQTKYIETDILVKIKTTFTVYSFLELLSLQNENNNYSLEIDYVKTGDIIQMGQYISTSYAKNYNSTWFAKSDRILFKININKNNNRWIYLSSYSHSPDEKEILLMRNSYFVVTEITFEIVTNRNGIFEFRTISVDLCADLDEAHAKSKQLTEQPLRITDDVRFRQAAKYAYDNYLSQPYKDDDKLLNSIYRYNNALANSLRKASYIILVHIFRKAINNSQLFKHDYTIVTYNDLLKLCIAVMFSVTAIESEEPISQLLYYKTYLKKSSIAFSTFALQLPQLFTPEDIKYYIDLIMTFKSRTTTHYDAWLMSVVYNLDMTRINPSDFSNTQLKQAIGEQYFADIIRRCDEILTATGDKRQAPVEPHTLPYADYDKGLFFRSNTNVEFCLNKINKILYDDDINTLMQQHQPGQLVLPVRARHKYSIDFNIKYETTKLQGLPSISSDYNRSVRIGNKLTELPDISSDYAHSVRIGNKLDKLKETSITDYKLPELTRPARDITKIEMFLSEKIQPTAFLINPNKKDRNKLGESYKINQNGLGVVIPVKPSTKHTPNCLDESPLLCKIKSYMYYTKILKKHKSDLSKSKKYRDIIRVPNSKLIDDNYRKYLKYKNKYLQLKYL